MKSVSLIFRTVVVWLLSLSLAFSSLITIPVQAQSTNAAPAPVTAAANLINDLDDLTDRALYPTRLRLTQLGSPSTSEVAQIQQRLTLLRVAYLAQLPALLQAPSSQEDEIRLAIELNTYFAAVQKYEGLKIILGLPTQPETWEATYGIKLSLAQFAKLDFLSEVATLSQYFVALPGSKLDLAKVENLTSNPPSFSSRIEFSKDATWLHLVLNPSFAQTYEQLALVTTPNTRNVLTYSLLWSAHRMYDSYATTNFLLRWPARVLKQPSEALRKRFVSMRVKRDLTLHWEMRNRFKRQKPQVLEAILDAMDVAYQNNRGSINDKSFIDAFFTLSGVARSKAYTDDDYTKMIEAEKGGFRLALVSLLNLSDLSNRGQEIPFIISEALRLTMRWAYLANQNFDLNAEAHDKVSELIEARVQEVVKGLFADGSLQARLAQIAVQTDYAHIRDLQRLDFQRKMQVASDKMRDFATRSINITYLIGVKRSAIQALNPSQFLQSLIDIIENQPNYQAAYDKYRELLFTMLQAFTFSAPLKSPLKLEDVFAASSTASFRFGKLRGQVDPKYIYAQTIDARSKDLKDLISVGIYLKFNAYEKLRYSDNPHKHRRFQKIATVESLKINDGLLGSDRQSYLEEMKKDLISSTPLLGAQVHIEGAIPSDDLAFGLVGDIGDGFSGMLWQYLADPQTDEAAKIKIVDQQLLKVLKQIEVDNATIDKELAGLESSQDEAALKNLGANMRTILTRAAQVSVGIQQFAGFDQYFESIRHDLMDPGIFEREWSQLNSWSNTAFRYVLLYYAFQLVSGRVATASRVTSLVGEILAPVFGANLRGLNIFLMGTIFFPMAKLAHDSLVTEPAHQDILNDFFACGSSLPCVALYSDVSQQQDITNSVRNELISNVYMMVGLYAGFRIASLIGAKLNRMVQISHSAKLLPKLSVLNLDGKSLLSEQALNQATKSAIANARKIADPVAAAAAEMYAISAHNQIEIMVWKEAARWYDLDVRFADSAERLGLNRQGRNWKDLKAVQEAYSNLLSRYKERRISTFEYMRLRHATFEMFQILSPLYSQMAEGSLNVGFMNRVWESSGVSASEIQASLEFYQSQAATGFQTEMDNYLAQSVPRDLNPAPGASINRSMERMLHQLASAIETDPENATAQVQAILKTYRRTGELQ